MDSLDKILLLFQFCSWQGNTDLLVLTSVMSVQYCSFVTMLSSLNVVIIRSFAVATKHFTSFDLMAHLIPNINSDSYKIKFWGWGKDNKPVPFFNVHYFSSNVLQTKHFWNLLNSYKEASMSFLRCICFASHPV